MCSVAAWCRLNTKDSATESQCFYASICSFIKWEHPSIRLLRGKNKLIDREDGTWYILEQDNLLPPIIPSISFQDILTGVDQASSGRVEKGEKFLAWGKGPGEASGRRCLFLHLKETWGRRLGTWHFPGSPVPLSLSTRR